MRFDDAPADGLQIDQSGVAFQVLATPVAAPAFDLRHRLGADFPMIEGPLASGNAPGMTPPARHAVDHGDVAADMVAREQRRPEMTRSVGLDVVVGRRQDPAADAHAFEVVDRLGKYRKALRRHAMRCRLESLAESHGELVINPAMQRIPRPGVTVLSGYEDVGRAGDGIGITGCATGRSRKSALAPHVRATEGYAH